jgi:hypothetical protein
MSDLSNHTFLVSSINRDLVNLIDSYLTEMKDVNSNDSKNLLAVLGAIQACLQELYRKGLGEKETAMLYYSIADRIIGNMVDKKIPKSRGTGNAKS